MERNWQEIPGQLPPGRQAVSPPGGRGSSGQHLEGRPGACQCLPCRVRAGVPPKEPRASARDYGRGAWEEGTCASLAWRSTAASPSLQLNVFSPSIQTGSQSTWSLPQGLALGQPPHLVRHKLVLFQPRQPAWRREPCLDLENRVLEPTGSGSGWPRCPPLRHGCREDHL